MRGRKKIKKESTGEEVDGYRNPDDKTLVDFAHVLYIGLQAGYTEREIARMYYSKWQALYTEFKKHHNMIIKKQIYQGV